MPALPAGFGAFPMSEGPIAATRSSGRRLRWGLLLLPVMFAGCIAAFVWAPLFEWARLLHDSVRGWGAVGVAGYIAIFALWNLVLPPSPLQALAAFIWGAVGGIAVVYAGSTIAIVISVLSMRRLTRSGLEEAMRKRPLLRAVDRAVAESGWKAVILLRLCNLIPSTVANLALGCTPLPLRTILWASWVGKFPGILLMGIVGAASQRLLEGELEMGIFTWVMLGVTVFATLAMVWILSVKAKRYWGEEVVEATIDAGSEPA